MKPPDVEPDSPLDKEKSAKFVSKHPSLPLVNTGTKPSRTSGFHSLDLKRLYNCIEHGMVVIEMTLCHEGLGIYCLNLDGILHAHWNDDFGIWKADKALRLVAMAVRGCSCFYKC